MSPSGLVTFVSELYDGSISDKESGILEKELWYPEESVMADRGFTIENDLKELKVDLNKLSFLGGRAELMAAEIKESQTIASVRIHVERAIQRSKKFKVIRNEIPLTLCMVQQISYGHGVVHPLFNPFYSTPYSNLGAVLKD